MYPCLSSRARGYSTGLRRRKREVRPRRGGPRDMQRRPDRRTRSVGHGHMDLAPAVHAPDILWVDHRQRPRLGWDVPHRDKAIGYEREVQI